MSYWNEKETTLEVLFIALEFEFLYNFDESSMSFFLTKKTKESVLKHYHEMFKANCNGYFQQQAKSKFMKHYGWKNQKEILTRHSPLFDFHYTKHCMLHCICDSNMRRNKSRQCCLP